jgi:hypothetical protein
LERLQRAVKEGVPWDTEAAKAAWEADWRGMPGGTDILISRGRVHFVDEHGLWEVLPSGNHLLISPGGPYVVEPQRSYTFTQAGNAEDWPSTAKVQTEGHAPECECPKCEPEKWK